MNKLMETPNRAILWISFAFVALMGLSGLYGIYGSLMNIAKTPLNSSGEVVIWAVLLYFAIYVPLTVIYSEIQYKK